MLLNPFTPPPPCESNAFVRATEGVVSVEFWGCCIALAKWGRLAYM